MPAEIELKLAIDPEAIARLLRHPALRAVRHGKTRTQRIASTYFDTPSFRLLREDLGLRLRRVGRGWVQTIKGPADAAAPPGLHVRREYEWRVPRPAVDSALLESTPWRKPIAKATNGGGFVPVCTTDFERTTIPIAFTDGTRAELCIDVGEMRAVHHHRTRRAAISEIEIEVQSGEVANAFRLALALSAELPLAVMTDSKAARGYALRRGRTTAVDTPVRASKVALAPDSTTSEALSAIARECLQHIAANVPGLLVDDDPEWVHQMRVGTRRLRSCLSLVGASTGGAVPDSVNDEVKWIAGILGNARDWDVFATETAPLIVAWCSSDASSAAAIKRMLARSAVRRRAARNAARAAVVSPRFQRLLLTVGLACVAAPFGVPPRTARTDRGPDGRDESRAVAFAASLLGRRHRKFKRRAHSLGRKSGEERHAARIAAKRLRYAAEFFAPMFAEKHAAAYIDALADVQDLLGRLNDAETAMKLAGKAAGADSAAARIVRDWSKAQVVALKPKLAKTSRRFAAAKLFWA